MEKLSPGLLVKNLSANEQKSRRDQLKPTANRKVQIAIPISGAAVGTDFILETVKNLRDLSGRYEFKVICRQSQFTQKFITELSKFAGVSFMTSAHYRETVEYYELAYSKNVISLEISKPSEQAFKALLTPKKHLGGVSST